MVVPASAAARRSVRRLAEALAAPNPLPADERSEVAVKDNLHYPADFFKPNDVFDQVPDGAIIEGYMMVVSYADPETGESMWLLNHQLDAPVSTGVGLLELAKLELVSRTPNTVTGISLPEAEDE
jgi:hypothetical protein